MKAIPKSLQLKLLALVLSIIIIVIAVMLYMRYSTLNPSADDAYVQANIVYVAPQVEGKIKTLAVQNLQTVKSGQLLFEIDPAQYQYAVNQADAQWKLQLAQELADEEAIKVAQAQLVQAQATQYVSQQKANRILALVNQGLASKEEGDEVQGSLNVDTATVQASQEQVLQAQQNLAVQKMQVKAAYAQLLQAQLNLQRTKVYATTDGYIENMTLRPGSVVGAGQTLFAIVDSTEWWVDANYKEVDLQRIKPGQSATITLDMYPGHVFKGTVAFISSGSGSTFSLLPAENATGNWVKITQRFPVKVIIPQSEWSASYPLRVGASATVRVDTFHR